jgi:O-glycosyl hydrolase
MVLADPQAARYVSGIAWHCYAGSLVHRVLGRPRVGTCQDFKSLQPLV